LGQWDGFAGRSQKLEQRCSTSAGRALLQPVTGILDQPDEAKAGQLLHIMSTMATRDRAQDGIAPSFPPG